MFALRKHDYRFRRDEKGWTLLCDGFALYRGLSMRGVENLLSRYRLLGGVRR